MIRKMTFRNETVTGICCFLLYIFHSFICTLELQNVIKLKNQSFQDKEVEHVRENICWEILVLLATPSSPRPPSFQLLWRSLCADYYNTQRTGLNFQMAKNRNTSVTLWLVCLGSNLQLMGGMMVDTFERICHHLTLF